MKAKLSVFATLILTLSLVIPGCSDTPPAVTDASTGDQGQVGHDGGSDGAGVTGRQYVVKSMVVPTDDATSKKYAMDFDNDGKVDNALGAILTAINSAASGIDMQKDMNQNILNGNVILLMAINAKNFKSDSSVTFQGWTGEKTTCCAKKPCSSSATTNTCFSGTHTFKVSASSPTSTVMNGSIDQDKFVVKGKVNVMLPIGKWPVEVTLLGARVEGTISQTGLTNGRIMGAIGQKDIQNKVLASVAKVLDGEMNDGTTNKNTRDQIKKVFDTNGDGTVSTAEVQNNAAVKALVGGDVDANGDGKKTELSAGVGFAAVPCTIATK